MVHEVGPVLSKTGFVLARFDSLGYMQSKIMSKIFD
jgi:hypothetical protein